MVSFGMLKWKWSYGVAFALLAAMSPTAHAVPIFSYSDSPTPTSFTSGSSSISIAGATGSNDAGFPGGANITIMTITLNGSGFIADGFSQSISFALTIDGHSIPFTGKITGSLDGLTSSITLDSSISPSSPITFNLGGYAYTVSYPAPSLLNQGANDFKVNVQATPLAVPEPASLALWGVVGLVGAWYGRRKMQRTVAL